MQSGVSTFCFGHPLLLAPTFVGPVRVPVRHAKRRCQKLYTLFSVGFLFSFVAGASKVCHSRRLDFEPMPPLAAFVLHLAELTRAPKAFPLALHLAEFSRAPKSPVESGKLQQRQV